jgi:hypothetical protein
MHVKFWLEILNEKLGTDVSTILKCIFGEYGLEIRIAFGSGQ